jgi:hypothetical protein
MTEVLARHAALADAPSFAIAAPAGLPPHFVSHAVARRAAAAFAHVRTTNGPAVGGGPIAP